MMNNLEKKTGERLPSKSHDSQRVPLYEKFAFASGDVACNFVFGFTGSLLTLFYTDYAGVSAATVGLVMLVSRFLDGGSDLLFACIVDKVKSKHGKARPWVLWMSVPFGITYILLFTVPADSTQLIKGIYVFVTYNLCTTVVYTALNLPYGSLSSLITRDTRQREFLQAFRMGLSPIGRILVTAVSLPIVQAFGDGQGAWIKTSFIFATIAIILLLFCFFGTKERVDFRELEQKQEKKKTNKESFKVMIRNKYWALCLGLWGVMVLTSTANSTILGYYAKYVLGDQIYVSQIYTAEQIAMIVCILFVTPALVKYTGKRNLTMYGMFVVVAAQLILLIDPTNVTLVTALAVVKGFGYGPLWGTVFAMLADACEYGQWKFHVRNDAFLFSAGSIGSKLGGGIAAGMVGVVLSICGYDGTAAVQTTQSLNAIYWVYVFLPIVLAAVQIVFCLLYKLDKMLPMITKELAEREARGEI
ncbi:MAG: glycoside-pentoside-hexuronide (GPH):cation symporter [Clostridiales Family XIII bacterium]|uniref:MFS transporter n=1 Tax=Hominibacterium faecale TaxID=2839743 RepID=UPI0022B2962B|nr:glycoside-pentoside-hexuronide (GPH):cation symporter [Hominibacterium faecale]MCC2864837.1 glycoside-pentoside-hexuronide (GPH):cation symporter [Anaerovorax odorimutans]MDY3010677.1 glycoside-pentoside-hexuronide (GPH):cation symporter [Clostridiales Family XIII bacterium]